MVKDLGGSFRWPGVERHDDIRRPFEPEIACRMRGFDGSNDRLGGIRHYGPRSWRPERNGPSPCKTQTQSGRLRFVPKTSGHSLTIHPRGHTIVTIAVVTRVRPGMRRA